MAKENKTKRFITHLRLVVILVIAASLLVPVPLAGAGFLGRAIRCDAKVELPRIRDILSRRRIADLSRRKIADLSRIVVVGDSLSAGFQNGSLLDAQQVNGYASVVTDQAGGPLPLPLIGAPGIPNVLTLADIGPPPVIVPAPGSSPGRTNPLTQPLNLAVPGHTAEDALTTRPAFLFDNLTDFVLGLPGAFSGISRSQVEWAEALAPTTILMWLGSNDVLAAAIEADASLVTPLPDFEAAYEEVIDRLAATGAPMVVANIPDVTVVPFLTSFEEVAAAIGLSPDVLGLILGIGPGDFVTPDAFDLISDILGGVISGPLPGDVVLDAAEVAEIRAATDAFNAVIAEQAAAKGAALVDIHAFTNCLDTKGYLVGGQRLTTDFLGGIFSLDGIHPTNTGYALIANEFIKKLNTHFRAGISRVSIAEVAESDPLVLPGVGRPAAALRSLAEEIVERLRTVLVP
ncbi:MAG: SGNH/GDSL hydrolase family protein [Nitrospinota bacterium]